VTTSPRPSAGRSGGRTRSVPSLTALNRRIVECRLCPRLVAYRETVARVKRRQYRDEAYWGRPLPGFGDPRGRVLVVGLAPAAHGGNRTGRMFTGDQSGEWLVRAMFEHGFANRPGSVSADDGLVLHDAYITAAARCAPPDNRPTIDELTRCRTYLLHERALLARIEVIVALGRVAFTTVLATERARGARLPRPLPAFAHGAVATIGDVTLIASFHPSRQNTQTRRLTAPMLSSIFRAARGAMADRSR
jgi:uracil-DNA glycosylase family 4